MQVLLISTYELGHQPFGLASPAAWLRRAGFRVTAVDVSRDRLEDEAIRGAGLAAFYLPMHTATRLSLPLIERVKRLNPACHLCCFGLYAPLNEELLRGLGAQTILGGEFEADLVEVATAAANDRGLATDDGGGASSRRPDRPASLPRLAFIPPDRTGLPALHRYASLRVDSEERVAGYTEASRGCKHLCRHCPIVPVYHGQFRVVPVDVVMADIRAQVEQGARHITFGDPDFFNGIGHALRVVEGFRSRFPDVTYDVTIKIEHLLKHAEHLGTLAGTGCLFVTSAVEALDDRVLALLAKGHTRADFEKVVALCREARLPLSPTFVAFTPWTTVESYLDLLETIDRLDLVGHVSPIQLALRLLIPRASPLLQLEEVRQVAGDFDPESLTHPWRHPDPSLDALQDAVMRTAGARPGAPREQVFEEVFELARRWAGQTTSPSWRRGEQGPLADRGLPERKGARAARATIPYLNEPWYC